MSFCFSYSYSASGFVSFCEGLADLYGPVLYEVSFLGVSCRDKHSVARRCGCIV